MLILFYLILILKKLKEKYYLKINNISSINVQTKTRIKSCTKNN